MMTAERSEQRGDIDRAVVANMPSRIPAASPDALVQLKILIVDDHPSNVLVLEPMLRDAGYARIHTGTDPGQVVDLCDRIKPDLLMLGLQMTPLDSVELTSRLQQLATTDQLPILVLTGDVSVDTRQQALSIGARDVVVKPLDQVEVLLRVRNLLETRQLHLQLERQNRLLAEHVETRAALTEQLRQTTLALDVANDAKARFLTSMSHELRTPLNAILGFTGTVLMGLAGPLSDEQADQLRTVQSSGRHLLSLINNLLDLATIESGRDELAIESIDGTVLLGEVAVELRPLADEQGL
jgi:DNA-binding response OmpR family regulator